MFNQSNQREAGKSILMGSMKGLANTGAAAVTFLATPFLYGSSVEWVQRFTTRSYGTGFSDLVDVGWFLIVACLVFFSARASLGTLLIMGGLAIATRLL